MAGEDDDSCPAAGPSSSLVACHGTASAPPTFPRGLAGRRFPNLTLQASETEFASIAFEEGYESSPNQASSAQFRGRWSRRPNALSLGTPTSRSLMHQLDSAWSPCSPDPERHDLKLISGDVGAIMFDFDGTLTASPGDIAQRSRKQAELLERVPLLAPRLEVLQQAGITLGIISKSSELTISTALRETGLDRFFEGPLLAKAVGLEGKAGFIADLVKGGGRLERLGVQALPEVMLVDDDVRELDRARARGIQTYPAPQQGGLQEEDFDSIFSCLGIQPPSSLCLVEEDLP